MSDQEHDALFLYPEAKACHAGFLRAPDKQSYHVTRPYKGLKGFCSRMADGFTDLCKHRPCLQ